MIYSRRTSDWTQKLAGCNFGAQVAINDFQGSESGQGAEVGPKILPYKPSFISTRINIEFDRIFCLVQ